jgi:SAM-dependent methyltransferase
MARPAATATATGAGHAAYTPFVLRHVYDWWVLGVSNRWLWRCPTPRLLEFFNHHLSDNHLDVGVGTGWYPDHARFPGPAPRLGLLDLSPHSLEHTARRVARYRPECHALDILEPLPAGIARFRSASLMYLLHCLPGTPDTKAAVFDHLRPVLAPDGVLFGATLVQGEAPRSAAARRLMALYNRKGVFSNTADTAEAWAAALAARFAHSTVRLEGCVALFTARG